MSCPCLTAILVSLVGGDALVNALELAAGLSILEVSGLLAQVKVLGSDLK